MELQRTFKRVYAEQLKRLIIVSNYKKDEFPYDATQVKHLANIYKPDGLLERLNPEDDFYSAIELYKAYRDIPPLVASLPDLWLYLSHVDLFLYVKRRWPIPEGKSEDDLISFIQNHWFGTESIRSTLSGLWWSAYLTVDESREDPFELTKILFENETFRSRVFGSSLIVRHRPAAMGILEYMLENKDKFIGLESKGREIAKHFNHLGGYKVLSALEKEYFKKEMEILSKSW